MPKNVALPDGRVVEFPDTMSDEDIGAAIESMPLAPASGPTKPKPPTPAQPLMDFATRGGQETLAAAPIAAKDIFSGLRSISRERWASAKKLADSGKPAEAVAHFLSAGFPTVELVGRIAQGATMQSWDQLQKAWAATKSAGGGLKPDSNMLPALGHLAGAFPFLGPHLADAWEKYQRGEESLGGALGTTTGTALSVATPAGLGAAGKEAIASPQFLRVRPTRDPVLASATAFGKARDVPMDVAQQSGSQFIRGAKNLAYRTILGRVAEPDILRQQAALGRVGDELLAETKPLPLAGTTLDPDALKRLTDLRQQLIRDTQTSTLANTALAPYSGQSVEELGRTVAGLTATPGPEGRVLRAAGPQTPVSAGGGVQSQLLERERTLGKEASKLYGRQEAIEADPLMRQQVQRTPAEIERALAARRNRMQETLGGDIPTTEELQELLHLRDRLEAGQYEQGGMAKFMESGELQAQYTPGHANDPIYHEITQAAPGTSDFSAKHMQDAITKALETGDFSYAAQGALQVARKRVKAGTTNAASRAQAGLPAAELPGVSKTYDVQMPVNIGRFGERMAPLRAKLEQQLPFARQPVKDAYTALIQLMDGPETVPFSQVEGALGALKRIGRGGREVAEAGTKTAVEGLALKEVAALEQSLEEALTKARTATDIETYQSRELFDEAMQAVEAGRKKTVEKYQVKDIRQRMTVGDKPEERVFQMLTQPGDFGIRQLQRVQQHAPESVANVGRALTDHLIEVARTKGPEAAQAAWAKVGPRTRAALYTPEHTQQLTQYFSASRGRELVEGLMQTAESKGYEAAHRAWKEIDPEIRAGLFTPAHSKKLGQYFKGGEGRELVDALMQTAQDKGYEAAERAWQKVDAKTRADLFSPEHGEQLTRYFRLGKGREVVDDLMKTAKEKGYRSANTAWKNLDDRAKAELFTPAHAKNLTDYFNLAEHMYTISNPSGSGYTAAQAAQLTGMALSPAQAVPLALGFGALSKLLHSEGGARVLMEGFKIPVKSPVATTAWARQAGAVLERSDDEEQALRAASRK